MDQLRSKTSRLRLLLNRVDGRKELFEQVNSFFDEAAAQLEARRADLLRDVKSHSVDADQQTKLIQIIDEVERLADAVEMRTATTKSVDLSDAERQLDACLSQEAAWLQCGRFDTRLAEKRTQRLMECLSIDWHDEWMMKRQADNPFAPSVDVAGGGDDSDDCLDEYKAAECVKSSYQLPNSLSFDGMLLGGGGKKDSPFASDNRPAAVQALGMRPQQHQRCEPQTPRFQIGRPAPRGSAGLDRSAAAAQPNKASKQQQPKMLPPPPDDEPMSLPFNRRPAVATKAAFDTKGAPASLAFLHGSFYVLEHDRSQSAGGGTGFKKGIVRIYDRRGRFKHPLPLRGLEPGVRLHRLRVCHQRSWLVLIDRSAGRVHCVHSNGSAEASYGPAITNRFSLNKPEDAICTGDLLFICCPSIGISIVALKPPPSAAAATKVAAADDNSESGASTADNAAEAGDFRVTQTNASLGLNCPVRLSWNYAERWLVVIDREGAAAETRYSAHRFRFERSGVSSRLVRYCGSPALLDAPPDCPPAALTFRSTVLLAVRDTDCVGRLLRLPAGHVFSDAQQQQSLRWSCQAEAKDWALVDACYMNTQEFAVCDVQGVCVLAL